MPRYVRNKGERDSKESEDEDVARTQTGSRSRRWRAGLRGPIRSEENRQVQSRREESGQEGRPEPEARGGAAGTLTPG
jgi:hypothetical protein